MLRHLCVSGILLQAFILGAPEAQARYRYRTVRIIYGYGEKLTEMGELPPEIADAYAEEFDGPVKVAYLSEHAHLFWLDVWTWNGRHVLQVGDKYDEPEATDWSLLIGQDPVERYGVPILYRIPALPGLLVAVIVFTVIFNRFHKTEEEKVQALMEQEPYRKAVEFVFGGNEETQKIHTSFDEQKYQQARDKLVFDGISVDEAEENLRKVVDAIVTDGNLEVDGDLRLAAYLDETGEWNRSADLYAQVIAVLPDTDERQQHAKQCLALVNEQRAAQNDETRD